MIFSSDVKEELSLDVHLKNQQAFIHGRDAFIYKYISRVRPIFQIKSIEKSDLYRIELSGIFPVILK